MKIVGHYHQRQTLARLIESGQIPSGLMFAGAEGIGKQLIAKALAKAIIAGDFSDLLESAEDTHTSTDVLFDSGNHPDFYLVECKSKEFNIEALRDLLYKLHLKTFNSSSRVIILNDANSLSIQAANVLLKTLEEPRPGTHFVLICSNPALMPSTIRSRCQLWFFDRLRESDIRHIIETQNLESELSAEERAVIADGSMNNLFDLEDHFDEWPKIQEQLDEIFSGNFHAAHAFAESISKDKELIPAKLHLIRLHSRVKMNETNNPGSKNRWACLLKDMLESEHLIMQRNLNPNYLLTAIFTNFCKSFEDSRLLQSSSAISHRVV